VQDPLASTIGYATVLHLRADVDRDDVGTFFGESNGVTAALATRRAGDEGDLAIQTSH